MMQDKDVRFKLNLFRRWQLIDQQSEITFALRQQRLVTALAFYGSRNREYLSVLLWPDRAERHAMESLDETVRLIYHEVPGLIVVDGSLLCLQSELGVDVHEFLGHFSNCYRAGADEPHNTCLDRLAGAELLPDWHEDWVILEQNRVRNVCLRALLLHAEGWLALADCEKAVKAAERALELEPLNEACVSLLMRVEMSMGHRATAVRTLRDFKARLASSLGMAPSDHLSNGVL